MMASMLHVSSQVRIRGRFRNRKGFHNDLRNIKYNLDNQSENLFRSGGVPCAKLASFSPTRSPSWRTSVSCLQVDMSQNHHRPIGPY